MAEKIPLDLGAIIYIEDAKIYGHEGTIYEVVSREAGRIEANVIGDLSRVYIWGTDFVTTEDQDLFDQWVKEKISKDEFNEQARGLGFDPKPQGDYLGVLGGLSGWDGIEVCSAQSFDLATGEQSGDRYTIKAFLSHPATEKRRVIIPAIDYDFVDRVLGITESHHDNRVQRMIELAPGVVTVRCRDPLNGGIESYFDLAKWKGPAERTVRGLHYIHADKGIGTLQVANAFSVDDYNRIFQETLDIMKEMLRSTNGTQFRHRSKEVNLKGRLSNS